MASSQAPLALVTGAGRGLGQAMAKRLAADGMRIAVADIELEAANRTAAAIVEQGGEAKGFEVDVADEASVEACVNEIRASLGAITVLVNNAGVISVSLVRDLDAAEWDRIIAVNLRGPFLCSKAVLPDMVTAGWGRIVNISSDAGKTAEAFLSHYSASKFGVIGLTQSLALEAVGDGITVNAICPVIADTDMRDQLAVEYAALPEVGSEEAARGQFRQEIPMGREARPEEVASLASFLCSEESAFITGQAINLSGGHEFH